MPQYAYRDSRKLTGALIITTSILLMFAAVEGCISSWLVSQYNRNDSWKASSSVRDRSRYLVFCSWWTVFFNFLYIFAYFVDYDVMGVFGSIASNVIYTFMTWVFWLAGAAAWTQAIGGGIRCNRKHVTYCSQQVAMEAFAWIEWILYCGQLGFVLALAIIGLSRGEELGDDMREV